MKQELIHIDVTLPLLAQTIDVRVSHNIQLRALYERIAAWAYHQWGWQYVINGPPLWYEQTCHALVTIDDRTIAEAGIVTGMRFILM